jgi:hypothetical protein
MVACTTLKAVIATRPSFCRRGSMTTFIATIRSASSTHSSMSWTSMQQALPELSRKTPAVQLTIRPICSSSYIYGYVNRVRSSRRLETEAGRNLEVIWLLCGLRPDFKTIADFRKDNRNAFKAVFREFKRICTRGSTFSYTFRLGDVAGISDGRTEAKTAAGFGRQPLATGPVGQPFGALGRIR